MSDSSPAAPHHTLSVHRTLGPLRLAVEIELAAPWTLIYGPSGSGKSSLLRATCGLLGQEGVTFTRITKHVSKPLISPHYNLPTHRPGLGYAPQQPTLFPHLDVLDNICFALQSRGEHHDSGAVEHVLQLFELGRYTRRYPHELSGGERQRVNLARAFAVPNAKLMLLDEPFSGVDRALRDRLLPRMQAFLTERNIPVLSVSHDVDEALLLNAEVVRLESGRIVSQGPAVIVLADERQRMLRALDI